MRMRMRAWARATCSGESLQLVGGREEVGVGCTIPYMRTRMRCLSVLRAGGFVRGVGVRLIWVSRVGMGGGVGTFQVVTFDSGLETLFQRAQGRISGRA